MAQEGPFVVSLLTLGQAILRTLKHLWQQRWSPSLHLDEIAESG